MKKIRIFILALIVFIVATIVGVKIILNGDKILVNFEILDVKQEYTNFHISFSEVKAAKHYVITIHDSNNRKVFESDTKKTETDLALTNLVTGTEYTLKVFAYDKVGDYRPCLNEYKFVWNIASLNKESTILLNNEDYIVNVIGAIEDEDYYISINNKEKELINEKVKEENYVISKDYYLDKEEEIIVKLLNGKTVVDELHLFNNMNPISDVLINTPKNDAVIPYNDFTLSFDGGDNALEYRIKIYKDNKVIQSNKTSKKNVIFNKKIFKVGETYRIEVNANYESFNKNNSIMVTMSDQIQLSPVYISNNWKYVKKGSKITLGTKDSDAKIYYTLNGDNPESLGTLYTEPIEISENVTLKTVAVADDKMNSIINTYDINVSDKEKLIVYLSPSNQHGNLGVSEVGYTNEMDEMNDLTNYIQERLEKNGVKVYRNNPAGNINQWNLDSNYLGADLHLAIHSNASDNHDKYGIETWIHTEASQTFSLANLIQNNLMAIYPYKELENADRGVRYANGALGEANDNYIPFGMLVEIAHHDYKDDALWIMQNKKLIGYNIADSILKYYQIID